MRRIVLIAGPTAVGKSSLAMGIAEQLDAEIVSIDSVQIYRGLDIGSAKPTLKDRERVRHHLIDELAPDEDCNVAEFAERALGAIDDIEARGHRVVAVGGTNLYVRVLVHGIFEAPPPSAAIRARHAEQAESSGVPSLHAELERLDPVLAERTHPNDLVRVSRGLEILELTGKRLSEHQAEHAFRTPNLHALKIAVNRPREELYVRIDERVDAMLDAGLVEEVRELAERGYHSGLKPLQSLGYRHVSSFLAGDVEYDEMVRLMKRDTRRFAKQQLSWLRSESGVAWARADVEVSDVVEDVRAFIAGEEASLAWTDPAVAKF